MSSLVLLSGGIDSAYLLTIPDNYGCRCLFIDYGQPAAKKEWYAACRIAELWIRPIIKRTVELDIGAMATFEGASIVPARNAVLLSMAANIAKEGDSIWIGCAPQDTAYPDCSELFLSLFDAAIRRSSGVRVKWSDRPRGERRAALTPAMRALTWSCYRGDEKPCGKCASCLQ